MRRRPFGLEAARRAGRRQTASRVRLEVLEDRQLLATITVTNTTDSAPGSFRAAILEANATTGVDTIEFNIPDPGVHLISLTSGELPAIVDSVLIDGTTQPLNGGDATTTPLIQVDGSTIPTSVQAVADGLTLSLPIGTSPATVRGLAIGGFTGAGILVTGAGSNAIQGNLIGIDATGTAATPNAVGIVLNGSLNNTVGGTVSTFRNVISGNTGPGVSISGAASGNVLQGNLIGTDATGSSAIPNTNGVVILGAANNTLGGSLVAARNLISGNNGAGVMVIDAGATGNVVLGNYIGLNQSGSAALGNAAGVVLASGSASSTIGGTSTTGTRNIISGNTTTQISVIDSTNNAIQGNTLGLDATGTSVLSGIQANMAGIELEDGASGNTIGGITASSGNVISGSAGAGLQIRGRSGTREGTASAAVNNLIQGNFIGTDLTGTTSQPNAIGGVRFSDGTTGNTLGGTAGGLARNVISGNTGNGVTLADSGTNNNVIQANTIGLQSDNTTALGNTGTGIYVDGAIDTQIGGSDAAASNSIASNQQAGVFVNAGTGIAIRHNAIFDNAGLGIDLAPVGVNLNRTFVPNNDGPNLFQNYPVITSVSTLGTATTIAGTLNSAPGTFYTIELFSNPTQDPSNNGQGRTFLGTTTVTTDTSGNASFTFSTASVTLGEFVSATATDPNGNTSEFSADATSEAPSTDLVLTLTAAPEPVAAGGILTYTLMAVNNGPAAATNVVVTDTLSTSVSFIGATASTGTIMQSGSTVTATLGTIASGSSATITITVVAPTVGNVTNAATVTLSESDSNPANNTQTVTSTVLQGVNLIVTTTATPSPTTVGMPLAITFTVSNGSTTTTATSVTLNAPLPAGVTISSSSSSQGTVSTETNTLVAGFGSLAPGASATVTVLLNPSVTGTLSTTASVSATETEVDPSNNVVGSVVTVNAATTPVSTDGPIVLGLDRAGFHAQPTVITVLYSGAMDVTPVTSRANYRLFSAGADNRLGTADDRRIRFGSILYDATTNTVTLRTRRRVGLRQRVLFAINGTTQTGVTDTSGLLLDGNADGTPGSNFIRRFRGVGPGRLALFA